VTTRIGELPLVERVESQAGVEERKRHRIVRDTAAVIYPKSNILAMDPVLAACLVA
jgi:hypothetical protein